MLNIILIVVLGYFCPRLSTENLYARAAVDDFHIKVSGLLYVCVYKSISLTAEPICFSFTMKLFFFSLNLGINLMNIRKPAHG